MRTAQLTLIFGLLLPAGCSAEDSAVLSLYPAGNGENREQLDDGGSGGSDASGGSLDEASGGTGGNDDDDLDGDDEESEAGQASGGESGDTAAGGESGVGGDAVGPVCLPFCQGEDGVCVDGECVDCETSSDCEAGKVCNPLKHECSDPCDNDIACGGERCHPDGYCVDCLTDGDCSDEEAATCNASGECSECSPGEVDCVD